MRMLFLIGICFGAFFLVMALVARLFEVHGGWMGLPAMLLFG
jgi:hypothetical protein